MTKKLVYSKHPPDKKCGVAYFSRYLAEKIGGIHINNFHGFRVCKELYINMDIYELDESEISSLIRFVSSRSSEKTILIMHDYRFTYFEDELVKISDLVVNLSGEKALNRLFPKKTIELFTPSIIEDPVFKFVKEKKKKFTLAFGFFSPSKKSFQTYVSFYDYMKKCYPDWIHLMIVSSHVGTTESEAELLRKILDPDSVKILDFIPGSFLSELISASDLGVCFYPTGIMLNNTAPMSFFSQKKPVITTYGDLTPLDFKSFTLDISQIKSFDFSENSLLEKTGGRAYQYYQKNLNWDKFLKKLYSRLKNKS